MSSTLYGFNPWVINARLRDLRATQYGIFALVIGFVLQVVGFVVSLGFQLTLAPPSWARAAVGAGSAALAAVIVFLAHRLLAPLWYRRGYRRAIVLIACYDDQGNRRHRPSANALMALGREKWPPREGEAPADYAKRVWHVDEVLPQGEEP
jgi:hypothetical protein